MKKIVTAIMGTISGLVLLFSYHTSTNAEATATPSTDTGTGTDEATAASTPNAQTTTAAPSATESADTSTGTSSSGTSSSGSSSTGTSSSASGTAASGTYTGDKVQTEWGIVQVQITVADGKITASEAIEYPNENPKDQRINAYALPILNAEVVDAQSANIDAVSGATVTSNGYVESLQSALDAAHLG